MLIDTGMRSEESLAELEAALLEAGASWRDIKLLVLTHMHPDHVGGAPRVAALTGARVAMHRAEAAQLDQFVRLGRPPWVDRGLEIAGTPRGTWDRLARSLSGMRDALREVHPEIVLEGGEEFETSIGTVRTVWTPGHSPGHICLHWPETGLLYAGDHMLETITPNIGWMPDRDMLGEYLSSLAAVEPLFVSRVLPSHGTPFSDHVYWIQQTRRHHEERCSVIARALDGAAMTAHELVPEVWERELSPFHYYFAVNEVLAHLEYMRRTGQLDSDRAEGGELRWRVLRELQAQA